MIKLEGYKIIKKIASGGMGDIYLAKHTVLETKVAIKSLHSDLVGDENFRKRFRKEARIQSRLSHPNIVKLVDFQERENGLFLIMEYIEGKQLNDYINKVTGPMPEDKLITLFKKILSAIQYAHSKKLIHRDIKPSNILITTAGNPKIIDFGIAKSDDEEKGLTKTGVQIGTVSYMSPEQVRAKKLDFLTDIYSLGITLFQMAVGKSPYNNQTNTFEIQLSIVSEPLPNPKEIYPSVSDKLIKIIEKATQKNKKDRYQSCEEFAKSFDKEIVKKTPLKKKNIEVNTTKEVKSIPKKNINSKKNKISTYKYGVFIGIIILVIIGFQYFNHSTIKNVNPNNTNSNIKNEIKTLKDNFESDRLAKLEEDRLAKLESDRLAKLEADRLAKERQLNLNKKRLAERDKQKNKSNYTTKTYTDGVYKGYMKNGIRTGKGTFTWSDGDVYEGDWVNDKRKGKGKYTWKDGESYEGDFKDDKINGYGTFKYGKSNTIFGGSNKNNDTYEGNWMDGLKHGQGKYTFSDGEILRGIWLNDRQPYKAEKKVPRKTHSTSFTTYDDDWNNWNYQRYREFDSDYTGIKSYSNAQLQNIIISPKNTQVDIYTRLYKSSVGIGGVVRVSFQGKRYWSIPTLSYIKIKGSQKKYKLISVYKKGSIGKTGSDTKNLDFEVLKNLKEDNIHYLSRKNYKDMYFAFIFEKLPEGATDINIYIGGSDVYESSDWGYLKNWKDIFVNNFLNVIVNNPKVETIKNKIAKSNKNRIVNSN